MIMKKEMRTFLPQIDKLLKEAEKVSLPFVTTRIMLKKALTRLLDKQRKAIQEGSFTPEKDLFSEQRFQSSLIAELKLLSQPTMKRVINATGTVIHTNLGRAPLSAVVLDEITPFLTGYSDLEFDLASGKRGKREKHLFQDLFQNYKMLIVNNNAAACLLVLSTFAKGKEVIVSRGELVEIGGSFRIPEIMKESGALLKEVGTTNKTKLSDYENAISDNTGLILKVHRSNFIIVGFTEEASSEQLVELGKKFNIPFYYDAGSGALLLLSSISQQEPIIEKEIMKGVNIITFSGDKLLGGTQAGIILADEEMIQKIKSNPLYRALRPDKFTIFYLARLFYYLSIGDTKKSPVIENLLTDEKAIKRKALKLVRLLKNTPRHAVKVERDFSAPGGGALPGVYLPTYVVKIHHPKKSEEEVRQLLLKNEPPIVTRQKDNATIIDLRTVFLEEIPALASALNKLFT